MKLPNKEVLGAVGIASLLLLYSCIPIESKPNSFSSWLHQQSEEQQQTSNNVTNVLVSPMEGENKVAGEHKEDGSNWSIPNIVRNLLSGLFD